MTKKTWAAIAIVSLGIFYFSLLWKSTGGDVDRLVTDFVFYAAICGLLWRRKDSMQLRSDPISSLFGLALLSLLVVKASTLFAFEARFIPLLPFFFALAITLVSCGVKGIISFRTELFFAWFLFFPTEVLGRLVDSLLKITVVNAKFATYLLYYVGFDVANKGNEVILSLPNMGQYRAIVNYPCAGVPMIALMLQVSLLMISYVALPKNLKLIVPMTSVAIGFFLGVIRVGILTVLIPEPASFDYWHGSAGNQIFSTMGIAIFAGFAYWILEVVNSPKTPSELLLSEEAQSSIQPNSNTNSFSQTERIHE